MSLIRPGLARRASARSSSRNSPGAGRRSTTRSGAPPAAGRPVGTVPVLLLGAAGLLAVGALAGAGTTPAPSAPGGTPDVVSADLAAHAPEPPAAAARATPTLALDLEPDALAVPTGAAAGVAPPSAGRAAARTTPAAPAVRGAAPTASGPSRDAVTTPGVRALAPVDPVEAWRDPGESMERTSVIFLAMAAGLGVFVLWLRRRHHADTN